MHLESLFQDTQHLNDLNVAMTQLQWKRAFKHVCKHIWRIALKQSHCCHSIVVNLKKKKSQQYMAKNNSKIYLKPIPLKRK